MFIYWWNKNTSSKWQTEAKQLPFAEFKQFASCEEETQVRKRDIAKNWTENLQSKWANYCFIHHECQTMQFANHPSWKQVMWTWLKGQFICRQQASGRCPEDANTISNLNFRISYALPRTMQCRLMESCSLKKWRQRKSPAVHKQT